MKRLIIISFLLIAAQAYTQETFFEFIPGWRALNPFETIDSEYLIFGAGSEEGTGNNYMLNTLSQSGTVIYQSSMDLNVDSIYAVQSRYTNSVFHHPNGVHFAGGSAITQVNGDFRGVLFKINEQYTDTVETYQIQVADGTMLYTVDGLGTDSLLITSYSQNAALEIYTTLFSTDLEGNTGWVKDFFCDDLPASICRLQPIHTLQCPDGGYLLTCRQVRTNNSCNFPVSSTLIKTDAQGNEQWRIRPGPHLDFYVEPGWPVLLDNGNVMFFWTDPRYDPPPTDGCWQSNDSTTVRFTEIILSDGEIINEGDYSNILPNTINDPDVYHQYYITQAQPLEDGGILLSGTNIRDAIILKCNQGGELIWHRSYLPQEAMAEMFDINFDTELYGVIPTSDGGFVGVGEFSADPFGQTWPDGIQTAFALKLDEYGCLEPGCQIVGIEEFQSEYENFIIYPNPASNTLRINASEGIVWDESRITDLLGQEVIRGRIFNSTVEVTELKTGLYILTLYSKGLPIHSQKFMKE